jgi:hypothetical protein
MMELVIQQIAAASISTNGQLGLLALWKGPHSARIGALPAWGQVLSERIPQYLFDLNNLPRRPSGTRPAVFTGR